MKEGFSRLRNFHPRHGKGNPTTFSLTITVLVNEFLLNSYTFGISLFIYFWLELF